MKAWLRSSLSLGSMMLFVSACLLVENFEGYGPIGAGGACANPPCLDPVTSSNSTASSSGFGGMGSGSSSSSGAGGSGGSGGTIVRCAKIPCNGSPCNSELLVPNSQAGLLEVDTESLIIRTEVPSHLVRIAKPGCTIAPFDQLVGFAFPEQGVVSDGQYVAWLKIDIAGACAAPALTFCNAANCQPQDIPMPAKWAEQGSFGFLALGPDHLYFTMRNGLVGRVPKGSTVPEEIWTDPATDPAAMKRGYLSHLAIADGQVAVLREYVETAGMQVCSGVPGGDSGAILLSSVTPGSMPQAVGTGLHFPSAFAISQKYVYFHVADNVTVLHRVPIAGGPVEKVGTNGTISATLNAGSIFVNKGWVYFRVALPNSMHGIARLPVDAPTLTLDAAEVVVGGLSFRTFRVDDDAVYWDTCADMACSSYRVLARVMAP